MPPKRKIPHTPNPGWLLALRRAGTQEALGKRIGEDQSEISRYMANLRRTPVRLAMRLDLEFGVPRHLTRPDLFPSPVKEQGITTGGT